VGLGLSGTGLSSLVHVLLERAALVQIAEPVVERHDQPEDVGVEVPREPNASGLSTVEAAWPAGPTAVSTRVTRWVRYSQPATADCACSAVDCPSAVRSLAQGRPAVSGPAAKWDWVKWDLAKWDLAKWDLAKWDWVKWDWDKWDWA
jgi:hypothetical protein